MTVYKYLASVPVDTLIEHNVISCLNEEGQKTLLIKNEQSNRITTTYNTKYLTIKKNAVLNHEDKEFFFHIIICRDMSTFVSHNFDVLYEYLFSKIDSPISEYDLSELLLSIEELFRRSKENIQNVQVGVAGELLSLMFLYDLGFENIFDNYHKNSLSKHDIEISKKLKIEIKTTVTSKRIHRFSHDQISQTTYNIYVISVMLSIVEKGVSLYELFQLILQLCHNIETRFSIQKLMSFSAVDEVEQGIKFSYEKSYQSIKFYKSTFLPRLDNPTPQGITNIRYDVDCEFAQNMTNEEIINIILSD